MTLSAEGLAAVLKAADASVVIDEDTPTDGEISNQRWDAVASAMIDYFKSNAVITGTCPSGTAGGPLIDGRLT